jgi:beta-1,4-mannooligosaccharide/beta-1,4-mannosyl-N-acetylglucosamine phosphorylase
VDLRGIDRVVGAVYHCYDARITRIEDRYYVMFAMDTDFGCRLGLAETGDFVTFDFLGITGKDDVRNGVMFPGRPGGKYLRYERPNKLRFESGVTSGDEIVLSESTDLVNWSPVGNVMRGRMHYWDELIGPGPPPIRTREGWLLIYHGIATHGSACLYQAGVALLDPEDPARVLSRGRNNVLEPREPYETTGQVPNVVFPTGAIVEQFDPEGFADPGAVVRIYYGAADTCVGLAVSTVGELIAACAE